MINETMYNEKDAFYVVLDVGKPSSFIGNCYDVVDTQSEWVRQFFYKNIFSSSQSTIGVISYGCEETRNSLSQKNGFEYISEDIDPEVPTWESAYRLQDITNYKHYGADFLAAVSLAINSLKKQQEKEKFDSLRIILFTAQGSLANESFLSQITNEINSLGIKLTIVTDKLLKSGHSDELDSTVEGIFLNEDDKTDVRSKNESIIFKLVKNTSGFLLKTDETHKIGSTVHDFSLRKVKLATPDELISSLSLSTRRVSTGTPKSNWEKLNSIEVDTTKLHQLENQLKLLISQPIEFERSTLEVDEIGFTSLILTPNEYFLDEFCKNDFDYLILNENTENHSFARFIKALWSLKISLISKITLGDSTFSSLSALTPSIVEDKPALLVRNLQFSQRYIDWFCPLVPLIKAGWKPNSTVNAQTGLKDAIKFLKNLDETRLTTSTYKKKSILCTSLEYLQAVNDDYDTKNLIERLGDARCSIQKFADEILKAVEDVRALLLFQNRRNEGKAETHNRLAKIPVKIVLDDSTSLPEIPSVYDLQEVGRTNPAVDFTILIDREDDFDLISTQIQEILWDFVFTNPIVESDFDKLLTTFLIYREKSLFYQADIYNDWMREFKEEILKEKMFDFWTNVIVEYQLGLLSSACSDMTDLTEEDAQKFYEIDN